MSPNHEAKDVCTLQPERPVKPLSYLSPNMTTLLKKYGFLVSRPLLAVMRLSLNITTH
jgi:hypothetical protein